MTLDLPPVWLALFVAAVWAIGRLAGMELFGQAGALTGAALFLAGLALMVLALQEMRLTRTTFIPHRTPSHLVRTGVFRLTRNPIYLGDAAVLVAAILWLDVPLALPLVPLFQLLIRERFIRAEEAALRAAFGAEFDDWAAKTRRWL